jgi:hypothetical protein
VIKEPKTAAEALQVWDAGGLVATVEMGGIGPGYEQCIHVLCFELIRALNGKDLPDPGDALLGILCAEVSRIDKAHALDLSGAQAVAGQRLAWQFMKYGYASMMKECPEGRRILVSKYWPSPDPDPGDRVSFDPYPGCFYCGGDLVACHCPGLYCPKCELPCAKGVNEKRVGDGARGSSAV